MHYLVTGGAGFIGSHLTESLLSAGHRVTVLDNFSTGSPTNLSSVQNHSQLQIIEDDIVAPACDLVKLIADCDAVFHLAAAVGVEMVINDPLHTIRTNIRGTENVIEATVAADKKSGKLKRFILASTSEVYGKSPRDIFSETDDLLIGPPTLSRWSYACVKLLDEFLLLACHRAGSLDGVVVRFFNTVGPRQSGRYGMVVPRLVGKALRNEPLTVYGDGRQSRCFCHVADVVRALNALLSHPGASGEIFNIGSQQSITIMELANLIVERLGSQSPIELIEYHNAYCSGFEDMKHRVPDTQKIRQLTDWMSEIPLSKIIDDVADGLRQSAVTGAF